jgi:hypothetical protein
MAAKFESAVWGAAAEVDRGGHDREGSNSAVVRRLKPSGVPSEAAEHQSSGMGYLLNLSQVHRAESTPSDAVRSVVV